jgi:hypothetical protein
MPPPLRSDNAARALSRTGARVWAALVPCAQFGSAGAARLASELAGPPRSCGAKTMVARSPWLVRQQMADLLRNCPSPTCRPGLARRHGTLELPAFAATPGSGGPRGEGRATPSRHGLPVPSPRTPAPPRDPTPLTCWPPVPDRAHRRVSASRSLTGQPRSRNSDSGDQHGRRLS